MYILEECWYKGEYNSLLDKELKFFHNFDNLINYVKSKSFPNISFYDKDKWSESNAGDYHRDYFWDGKEIQFEDD